VTLTLDHRIKVLIAVLLMLVLAAGGWLLGVQPAVTAALDAATQETAVRTQNDAARATLAELEKAQSTLPALKKQLVVLDASVPATPGGSELLDSIDALADARGVTVQRIAIDAAVPYLPPTPADAAVDPETGEAVAGPPADPALVPTTDPRITSDGFVVVPVALDVTGTLTHVLQFVHGVQNGPRLFLVNKFSSVTDEGSSSVKATMSGFVYVLLDGVDAAAQAAAPAA
jgi:Tfp pilus assembly protein PilO